MSNIVIRHLYTLQNSTPPPDVSSSHLPLCIIIPGMQHWYNIYQSINVNTPHKQHKGWKSHDYNNRCTQSIWQNPAPIYDMNSQQNGNRGSIPHHNKGHIWETQSQHPTQRAKTRSVSLKIRNKRGMSAFTMPIQHSTGSPGHSEQARFVVCLAGKWGLPGGLAGSRCCRAPEGIFIIPNSQNQSIISIIKVFRVKWFLNDALSSENLGMLS